MLKYGFPGFWWLSLLLIPVLLFYFLRTRFRRQPSSSIYIWSRLRSLTRGAGNWRRRSIWLLILQVLAILTAVAAITQSGWYGRELQQPGMIFLIDVSASMSVTEGSGINKTSRIEQAKRVLIQEMRALPPQTKMMIFLCATRLVPLGEPTRDINKLINRVKPVSAGRTGFAEVEVAGELQAWLKTQSSPWRGCLITDGGLELGGGKLAAVFDGSLRAINVGSERKNIGVTNLRQVTQEQVGFLIYNGWPTEKDVLVKLAYNQKKIATALLRVKPGISSHLLNSGHQNLPGCYQIELVGANDAFSLDDRYYLAVNEPRRIKILLVSPGNQFLRAALDHPAIKLTEFAEFPQAGLKDTYWDLVIADRVKIPAHIGANLLAIGELPPGAPMKQVGKVSGALSMVDPGHSLLRFVKLDPDLAVTSRSFKAASSVQVLATIKENPVLAAWEENGFHRVACGLAFDQTNLGLTTSLPIMIRNLCQWVVPQWENPLFYNLVTGEPRVLVEQATWRVTGKPFAIQRNGNKFILNSDFPGSYQWKSGLDQGYLGVNLPFSELEIAPRQLQVSIKSDKYLAASVEVKKPLGELFLSLCLVLLVAEWILWRGGWPVRKEGMRNVVD